MTGLRTEQVWAAPRKWQGNTVSQLLVPAGPLTLAEESGSRFVHNPSGRWPAAAGTADALAALVPDGVDGAVDWIGPQQLSTPQAVLDSYPNAIQLHDLVREGGLRPPQAGALHAVIGYWYSQLPEPGLVVMPTGTGKTETMLTVLVACRPERLLVLVPSVALRDQIAAKFESLGILQQQEIVSPAALRPCVGRVTRRFTDAAEAKAFASACNVVVATPSVLHYCVPEAREALLAEFSHLIVDEAHHAPASTWTNVIRQFEDRRVLLFTATPFREDGRKIPGRTVFRYPLRQAQAENYFTTIDYRAVLSLEGNDQKIAELAVQRLRADLEAGYDHLLMARVNTVRRAREICALYQELADDLGAVALYDGLSAADRKAALASMHDRSCRIVVCVNMLGEGFDMPQLKVAAVHDVRKSLSPMIQFIGRFTRASTLAPKPIGTASVFVARDPAAALSPLRDLLKEDADWDLLLHDITERSAARGEKLSDFDASFTHVPADMAVSVLEPKMSAVAHRAPSGAWDPQAAISCYGEDRVLGQTVATGADGRIAWFVVEHRTLVDWGAPQFLEQTQYELIVMYFDDVRRLLYIYGSHKKGDYKELARRVLGGDSQPIKGLDTFRVFAGLERVVATNIGLLDSRDHFNRFSLLVGSDVFEALNAEARKNRSQTHIIASGLDDGTRVSVCAALSGRFWSPRTAPNLLAWMQWCDAQGTKILDSRVDLEHVMAGFIIPVEQTERPPFPLLSLEWPWQWRAGLGEGPPFTVDGRSHPVTDIGFRVDDFTDQGPLRFSLVSPTWQVAYSADFTDQGLVYSPVADDALVRHQHTTVPAAEWINKHKPYLYFAGDRLLTPDDRLHAPRTDLPPFDLSLLKPLGWNGVDIKIESMGPERLPHSVQHYMSLHLSGEQHFDILVDDDGSGEVADLVGITADDTDITITLVHCKYSCEPFPGARVDDLYEVCGQAARGAKWREYGIDALLRTLDRRAGKYAARNPGKTPYLIGSIDELYRIRERAPHLRPHINTVIAQPGLSAAACSSEQQRLLAGAHSYVRALTKGTFTVYCSP
ncbi:DEAD/DEAH box helicase family protein [Streptomyces longwoodensis]|uniref:DEAD/DEAH box helicase n=1 Tax=Streptomyces longwoodensis TaxID=68231 RepID=UPI0033D3F7D8